MAEHFLCPIVALAETQAVGIVRPDRTSVSSNRLVAWKAILSGGRLRWRWVVLVLAFWVGGYLLYRSHSQEIWSENGRTYVILPAGPGIALYYLWRPLMLADAALTDMRFHIGPHR